MFDVGFSELVILFVIGLLILGPERLPRVATQLGRWIGRARRTAHQLRLQIEREMALNEINRTKKPPPAQSPEKQDSGQTNEDGGSDDETPDGSGESAAPAESAAETGPETEVASNETDERRAVDQ